MATTIINRANHVEHLQVSGPNGQLDSLACHPGRSTLAEGYTIIKTGKVLRHITVDDGTNKTANRLANAKQPTKTHQKPAGRVISGIPAPRKTVAIATKK